jgi:hypothetical protein
MWDGRERRQLNRKPDNFTPSTAFEGYVAGKLEDMTARLNALPCPETFKRLNKIENDVANIQGRAAIVGLIFGAIAGFITKHILGQK